VKIALTVIGASSEFAGIFLVASPELFPRAAAIARFLMARLAQWRRRLGERWHRLLFRLGLRQGRHVFGKSTVTGVGHASAKGFGYRPIDEDESIERQLALLHEFVEKTEARFHELEESVSELPGQWQQDIRAARDAIESMMVKRLKEAEDRHRVRLVGIAFLMAGVPILAYANVIS
jgi:hypothetical protein